MYSFKAFLLLLAVFMTGCLYQYMYFQGFGWPRFLPVILLGLFGQDIIGWIARFHHSASGSGEKT